MHIKICRQILICVQSLSNLLSDYNGRHLLEKMGGLVMLY